MDLMPSHLKQVMIIVYLVYNEISYDMMIYTFKSFEIWNWNRKSHDPNLQTVQLFACIAATVTLNVKIKEKV